MARLVSAGDGRIRCWFAGAPSLADQTGSLSVDDGEVLRLAALAHSTCRQLVQRLFDFYWVSLRSPDLLDRIVFYSGGHPRILFLLLRELFEQRGRHHGRSPFQDSHVEGAWISENLRQEAGRLLLAPLDGRPDLRLALGYVLQLAGEGISPDEIKEFIGEHRLTLDVVEELCVWGIVERSERTEIRYRLPSSGLGQLIAERMGDGEQWLKEAEIAWRESTGAPLLE
jgi:hypothetical protein